MRVSPRKLFKQTAPRLKVNRRSLAISSDRATIQGGNQDMISKRNSLAAQALQSTITVAPVSTKLMESFESVGKGINMESSRNRQRRLNYAVPLVPNSRRREERKVIYEVVKGSVTIDDQLTTASKINLLNRGEETAGMTAWGEQKGNQQVSLDSPQLGLTRSRKWSLTKIRSKDELSKSRSPSSRKIDVFSKILTAHAIQQQ